MVTAVEAEPGAVRAAGTPVLRRAPDGPQDAVFSVPEDRADAVRVLLGKAGALKLRAWGAGDAVLPATVREVAAVAGNVRGLVPRAAAARRFSPGCGLESPACRICGKPHCRPGPNKPARPQTRQTRAGGEIGRRTRFRS